MKRLLLLLIVVGGLILGTDMDLKAQSAAKEEMRVAKAPLFRDPIHDGAADPMVIYNEQEKAWYMFYTNRRANVPTQGTNWNQDRRGSQHGSREELELCRCIGS